LKFDSLSPASRQKLLSYAKSKKWRGQKGVIFSGADHLIMAGTQLASVIMDVASPIEATSTGYKLAGCKRTHLRLPTLPKALKKQTSIFASRKI
jgi:hypothetical protein